MHSQHSIQQTLITLPLFISMHFEYVNDVFVFPTNSPRLKSICCFNNINHQWLNDMTQPRICTQFEQLTGFDIKYLWKFRFIYIFNDVTKIIRTIFSSYLTIFSSLHSLPAIFGITSASCTPVETLLFDECFIVFYCYYVMFYAKSQKFHSHNVWKFSSSFDVVPVKK